MSTDTNLTNRLRDMPMDTVVTISFNGQPGPGYTVEAMVDQHDAALAAARREGALLILQKMEDILYQVAANGRVETIEGQSAEWTEGVYDGSRAQLESARDAIAENRVDFTLAPE